MALDNNTQLVYTDKITIKNWFKTGLKPKQDQFWAQFDSYWHKSESLPISSISGLGNLLDGKAESDHTHDIYATNDATSLTAQNITQWQNKLGINDLDYVVIPTEDATVESHPYVVVIDNEGNSARRNATDFGKVSTVNDKIPDTEKNIDINFNDVLLKGSKTTQSATFEYSTGQRVKIDQTGVKYYNPTNADVNTAKEISFWNVGSNIPSLIYSTGNIDGVSRILALVTSPFPSSTGVSKSYILQLPVKDGIVATTDDIQAIFNQATNWTHSQQRFSALADKSADATYNRVLVTNNVGQINYADLLTSEFIKFTENGKVGFGLKYRKDNPTFYSAIGNNAVDLSIQTASSRGGALGNDSVAIGLMGKSTGVSSTSLGNSNTASGNNSLAAGTMNTANGSYSLALGYLNTASQGGDTAIGYKNIANGGYATAIGVMSEATGRQSIAMGTSSRAVGKYSTAIGYGVKSSTELSTAIGNGVESYSYSSIVIGSYNVVKTGQSQTATVPTDDLFVIGNGFRNPTTGIATYSNALEIKNNGHTVLPSMTVTMIEGDVKSVVTKEYLDIIIPKPPTTGEYTLKSINGVVSWVLN